MAWADLPRELVSFIADHLPTGLDHLRIRGVCRHWRDSIPPREKSPNLPQFMYFPSDDSVEKDLICYLLHQTTVYRLEKPKDLGPSNSSWLFMVNELPPNNKLCAVNPFTMRPYRNVPYGTFPRKLDFYNFHVTEVCKCFTLQRVGIIKTPDDLIVYIPDDDEGEDEEDDDDEAEHKVEVSSYFNENKSFMVLSEGNLMGLTIEDEYWRMVDGQTRYIDIASHNNKFYTVDRNGMVGVTHDFEYERRIIPPVPPFTGDWYLVKSDSDLFLVGRDYRVCDGQVIYDVNKDKYIKKTGVTFNNVFVSFKAYVLIDEDPDPENQEWEELEDLDDLVFFVSRRCSFALSASVLANCKGNRIIYVDEVIDQDCNNISNIDLNVEACDDGDDNSLGGIFGNSTRVGVYNLEDGLTVPLTSCPEFFKVFLPLPI